jgi:metal-responsive CopG/Arc/MetJ family transcriptional regulator
MKTLLKTTSIKIPQELLDSLQELANKDQRVNSRNDLIKNILFDYVEANNEK